MKRILGIPSRNPPPPAPPTIADTIDNVEKQAEGVDKKINQCDNELRKIHTQMKTLSEGGAKNLLREKARRVLARRKQYEVMSGNMHQQSFNMEQATSAIQTAKANQQIFSAMKDGAKQMRKVLKNLKVDEIDAFQDEMEDIYETSEEIQFSLGRNYTTPDIDESQLEAELEALGDEIVNDNDKSYLDEATKVPGIKAPVPAEAFVLPDPEKPPSQPKFNAVRIQSLRREIPSK